METGVNAHPKLAIAPRLRIASVLVVLGLIIETFTLFWTHPLAFIAFIIFGCALMGLGMAIYLWSLVTIGDHANN